MSNRKKNNSCFCIPGLQENPDILSSRLLWDWESVSVDILVWYPVACDHALSLYLCNLFSGRGHDTFLSQITCKKARIWTFFWLDRKQYGWFALFQLAKTPPSVSCCWFQSAFLLAYKWAVNKHASSLWNFCRLCFLEFEECLNRNFIHWNIFHFIVY